MSKSMDNLSVLTHLFCSSTLDPDAEGGGTKLLVDQMSRRKEAGKSQYVMTKTVAPEL